MKQGLTYKIEGLDELTRKLKAMGDGVEGSLADVLKAGAEPIRESASQKAPRRTGRLASHIIVTTDEKAALIGPDKARFYGMFQEFGTSHHAPQPFLRPALDEQKETAQRIIADKIKEILGA